MEKKIVFFAGICGLRNSFIDLLLKDDKHDIVVHAPLQGETAQEYIRDMDLSDLKTIVFYWEDKLFIKSDAMIEVVNSIGGIWRLTNTLKLIPRRCRNYLYSIVATKRIKWFGQKEACRMPTEKERVDL